MHIEGLYRYKIYLLQETDIVNPNDTVYNLISVCDFLRMHCDTYVYSLTLTYMWVKIYIFDLIAF